MHCEFPIFINGTITLHVSGSFSAHQQERYQPYDGLGTILCSSLTDCCQDQDGNWKFTVHLLVSFISKLRDARSYNPKMTSI